MRILTTAVLVTLAGLACAAAARSQDAAGQNADELAKQLSNPVASLISVPFQLNYDAGYDGGGEKWQLNLQPVIPVNISEDWNMISRTILPVIDQHDVVNAGSQSGTGDTTQSLFFSPKKPTAGGWIIGVGPVFLLPTASDELLGTEKWSLGPTAVVLKQTDTGWSYGALANHLWSVAGDDDRANVSNTFLQPFLTRSLGKGQTITANLEASYDWNSSQATVPLNLTYSKVIKLGGQMASIAGGGRAYLDAPDGGPEWGLRLVFTLLFPEK